MATVLMAVSTTATPNTCQPRATHPFLPTYHLIGNVTSDEAGKVTAVEDINDVSSVFLWKGVYHVFHQCCQNHWDHAVSRDLVHWTRLPPPSALTRRSGLRSSRSNASTSCWSSSDSVTRRRRTS